VAGNPCLDHLLGVNQFFVDLAAHARAHPGTRLARWWSEQQAAALFRGVHPDGHGLWQVAGPAYPVLFWLHSPDRETHLRQALADLPAPRCPVATGVRASDAPAAGPAGAVWALAGGPAGPRLALHQLPGGDHGQDTPINPNWVDGHLSLQDSDGGPGALALPADLGHRPRPARRCQKRADR
jgi:hypothetical protein